ncbi:C-C motif chemokine 24-like [Pagrus major]|uniref:C-C motif chemokine 24-like n=1 Tax=Pagrus major TaxID=143350 RepID=UPI003CC840A1
MASRVAALLLLGVICVGFASGQTAVDCCLTTVDKFLPLSRINGYIIQEAGNGCDKSATVFTTKTGRILCVSHPSKLQWVRSHIESLEAKKPAKK